MTQLRWTEVSVQCL